MRITCSAGAAGFIMKDASFDDFITTIRAVAGGVEVLPRALTNSLFSQIAQNASRTAKSRLEEAVRLTARERQVIDLLGVGLSNKEIAARLHIAVHTVKSHVHNVLEKLALRSRLEVAAFSHSGAGAEGLLPANPFELDPFSSRWIDCPPQTRYPTFGIPRCTQGGRPGRLAPTLLTARVAMGVFPGARSWLSAA